MKTRQEKIDWLLEHQALLKGHFLLASGLHSEFYVQTAKLFEHPHLCETLAQEIVAENPPLRQAGTVVSLALGAIIWGHELARALGRRHIFAERSGDALVIRRNFTLEPGEKIVVAEDVVTSGGSIMELVRLLQEKQAEVQSIVTVVNRSAGRFMPPVPNITWLEMELPTYEPRDCPLCKDNIPFHAPGTKQSMKPR
ncbi:MAG: orotate phosphoribosyltransferase [Candidatus Sumerlaeia bacterium]